MITTLLTVYILIGLSLLLMDYMTDKNDYVAIYRQRGLLKTLVVLFFLVVLWPAVVIKWLINTHGGEK